MTHDQLELPPRPTPDLPTPRARRWAVPMWRGTACAAAFFLALYGLAVAPVEAQSPASPTYPPAQRTPPMTAAIPAPPSDGAHDFDFLHGNWRIHNRRLRSPLTGSAEWYEFGGTAAERPLWDGQGMLEEYEAELPTGRLRGLALHLYNPKSREWTLYWSSSSTGTLDRGAIGKFKNGRGEFYNQDEFEGRTIFVRSIWTSLSPTTCRWEQAFSADGGQTWETNWVMEFTRVP